MEVILLKKYDNGDLRLAYCRPNKCYSSKSQKTDKKSVSFRQLRSRYRKQFNSEVWKYTLTLTLPWYSSCFPRHLYKAVKDFLKSKSIKYWGVIQSYPNTDENDLYHWHFHGVTTDFDFSWLNEWCELVGAYIRAQDCKFVDYKRLDSWFNYIIRRIPDDKMRLRPCDANMHLLVTNCKAQNKCKTKEDYIIMNDTILSECFEALQNHIGHTIRDDEIDELANLVSQLSKKSENALNKGLQMQMSHLLKYMLRPIKKTKSVLLSDNGEHDDKVQKRTENDERKAKINHWKYVYDILLSPFRTKDKPPVNLCLNALHTRSNLHPLIRPWLIPRFLSDAFGQ